METDGIGGRPSPPRQGGATPGLAKRPPFEHSRIGGGAGDHTTDDEDALAIRTPQTAFVECAVIIALVIKRCRRSNTTDPAKAVVRLGLDTTANREA